MEAILHRQSCFNTRKEGSPYWTHNLPFYQAVYYAANKDAFQRRQADLKIKYKSESVGLKQKKKEKQLNEIEKCRDELKKV